MLPLILQHVREMLEARSGLAESGRYKIITPFPPDGPDFAAFEASAIDFGDPPRSGDSASLDTIRAFEFFKRTDNLYYDYSYGIKSEDYMLSHLCQRFYRNAKETTKDTDFTTTLGEKSDAYLNKYLRSTVGDLGIYDFRYSSSSPVSWQAEKIVINTAETERLKLKTIKLYEELGLTNVDFVKSLIETIRASSYAAIQYDFGFFDVIREWFDPHLLEAKKWAFAGGDRTLYGETDPTFAEKDVKLCCAQRFYLVRNCTATAMPPPPAPVIRDDRGSRDPRRVGGGGGVRVTGGGTVRIRDHRRKVRNGLIAERLAANAMETLEARPGFVWVPATATVPGHWEREKAGGRPGPPDTSVPSTTYRVAALKCRIIPQRP
jgi:hypothetical protein